MQSLCCQLCYVTVANQRTIVEIQILATVSWTCGCQPFSCPCSQNVMHCRKEMCWSSLFKESIPAIPFWNSKHPTYQKLELPESRVRSAISALLHHSQICCSWREKPVSCRKTEGVMELWSPRIVATNLLCSRVTTVKWAFSLRRLEAGRPAFQLRMFAKCDTVQNEIWEACLFQESIPAILFWNSKHPLPTRSLRFLRAAVCSTSSAVCLHHAHPFVAAAEKHQSHAEKQRVWSRVCRVQDLFQYTVYWLCSCMTAAN